VKVYRGIREDGSCRVRVVERRAEDGTEWSYELRPRPEMFAKPPAPFDWAADGSGTMHLAAALLVDLGADGAALRALVPYFRRLLSRLPADGFEVSDTFLEALAYALGANTNGNGAAGRTPAAAARAPQQAPPVEAESVGADRNSN
jgi:hypothetical protein